MTHDATAFITVGRIGPARGVKGDVFVEPWTDAPLERFAPGMTLRTDPADAGPLTVGASSTAGGKLVVHFTGFDGRVAIEALRGVRVLFPLAERPELDDPDEFYDSELIGLQAQDSAGEVFGPVTDVVHASGATFLVLDIGGRECLVPFVAVIVPIVDVPGGAVVIDPPVGLFDL